MKQGDPFMRPTMVRSLLFLLVFVAGAYAIAEDITLTTYYPSPRGVYQSLQTTGATNLATTPGSGVAIGTENFPTAGAELDVNGTIQATGLTITGAGVIDVGGNLIVQGQTTLPAPTFTSCNLVSGKQLETDASGRIICGTDGDTSATNEVSSVTAGAGLSVIGNPIFPNLRVDVGAGSGIQISGDQLTLQNPSKSCATPGTLLQGFNLSAAGSPTCIIPSGGSVADPLMQGVNITFSAPPAGPNGVLAGPPIQWNPNIGGATINAVRDPNPQTAFLCADGWFSRGIDGSNNPACNRGLILQPGSGITFSTGGAVFTSGSGTLTMNATAGAASSCAVRRGAPATGYGAVFCGLTEKLTGGGCGHGTTGGNTNFGYPVTSTFNAVTGHYNAVLAGSSTARGFECYSSGGGGFTPVAICCQ